MIDASKLPRAPSDRAASEPAKDNSISHDGRAGAADPVPGYPAKQLVLDGGRYYLADDKK